MEAALADLRSESDGGHGDGDPVRSAFVMAVQLLEAGRASLLLRQDADPYLTMAAAVGIKPSLVETIQVRYGSGIAGIVAERGFALLGRSLSDETFLSAPIVTRHGVEGVLNLTNRLGNRQFSGRDLASTGFVAAHIANLLEFRREAAVDVVTRLPNRKAFEEALDRELARGARTGAPFSLVFIDLDKLKAVNDREGHTRGDELLRSVATILKEETRQYDYAARYAGDEFVVLLSSDPAKRPGEAREAEASFGRRLLARCARARPPISISAGVARFPDDGRTALDLIQIADKRMYEYKRRHGQGRAP